MGIHSTDAETAYRHAYKAAHYQPNSAPEVSFLTPIEADHRERELVRLGREIANRHPNLTPEPSDAEVREMVRQGENGWLYVRAFQWHRLYAPMDVIRQASSRMTLLRAHELLRKDEPERASRIEAEVIETLRRRREESGGVGQWRVTEQEIQYRNQGWFKGLDDPREHEGSTPGELVAEDPRLDEALEQLGRIQRDGVRRRRLLVAIAEAQGIDAKSVMGG